MDPILADTAAFQRLLNRGGKFASPLPHVAKRVVQRSGDRAGMRLFICIAAGASERILPSLIGRSDDIVETKITATTAATTSSGQASPRYEKSNEQADS